MSTSVTFDDAGLIRLRSTLDELKKLQLRVGYQEQDGKEKHDADSMITVAKLAAVMEFGVPGEGEERTPERNFIRSTLRENERRIADVFEHEIQQAVTGDQTAVEAYSKVGSFVVGLIHHKLDTASSWAEPLDPDTVEAKGHRRVLDETGKLKRNLSWRVSIGSHTLASGRS